MSGSVIFSNASIYPKWGKVNSKFRLFFVYRPSKGIIAFMTVPFLRLPYYQTHEISLSLAGETVRVVTKPGLPAWDQVTPAEILLAEHVDLTTPARYLLFGAHHGALAVALARRFPQGDLLVVDPGYIALQMTSRTLSANTIQNARVSAESSLLPAQQDSFAAVLMVLPKGRRLARRWLVETYPLLSSDGTFYLAGANSEGIQSVIQDAGEVFGKSSILDYRKGNRVARFRKGQVSQSLPGWASEPGCLPGTWRQFDINIRGVDLHIRSLPGVFSYDRLDDGTRLLIDHLEVLPGSQVLDFGCGYGVLGLYAALSGAAHVDMVDDHLDAVACAQENIRLNGLHTAQAFPGDGLDWARDQHYDLVVSNLPFHTGKEVDYGASQALIAGLPHLLKPGGQLVIVANRFIRYESLMEQAFGNVVVLARTGKYHVLKSIFNNPRLTIQVDNP